MTPATCGSRYRGPHHTYTCKRTPGHDGPHTDQYPSGNALATWTDAMSLPVADQPTPEPIRDDDQRQQHRRTLQFILNRLDRGDRLGGYEVAELRRVTAAEQAENDADRASAARWERLYHLTQDRLSEQIRSTQKARQQRSQARERARTAERRAEAAEARAAMAEATADLRTQRVEQLERSRDCWKRRAIQAQDDRDRYAAQATRLRVRRGGLYRQIRETAGYPLPTDATQEDRAVQEFARDLERWIPLVAGEELSAAGAEPDLTTPVTPREPQPARNDHPLWDLRDALTGPAISNDDAMSLIRAYYNAITSAPPADRDAIEAVITKLRQVLR